MYDVCLCERELCVSCVSVCVCVCSAYGDRRNVQLTEGHLSLLRPASAVVCGLLLFASPAFNCPARAHTHTHIQLAAIASGCTTSAMSSLDARTGMFRPSLEKHTLIHRALHLGAGESDGLLIQAEGMLVAPELEDGVGALLELQHLRNRVYSRRRLRQSERFQRVKTRASAPPQSSAPQYCRSPLSRSSLPRLPGSTPGSASLSFISLLLYSLAGPELECEKKVQFCTTILYTSIFFLQNLYEPESGKPQNHQKSIAALCLT